MRVEEAFARFQMLLKAQRNVKDSSLNTYMQTLRRFLEWTCARKVKFEDWNAELVTKYIAGFKHPMTRHSFAMTLKYFFKELGLPDAEKIKIPPRPKRKLPDILYEDDVLKLAKACDSVRDRALVLLTYESTRRNHEIVGLRIRDVKFDEWGALVTFHSNKSEDATIRCMRSASVLQQLIELHPNREDPEAPLFVGSRFGKALSASSFRYILYQVSKKARVYIVKDGEKKAVWPHLLRHSGIAAMKMRKDVYSDDDIMNVSGHSDRRQLDIYGKITMALTNERRLQAAGLKEGEGRKRVELRRCPRCGQVCDGLKKFCVRCQLPLDEKEILRVVKEKEAMDRDLKVIREHLPLLLSLVEEARKREQQ